MAGRDPAYSFTLGLACVCMVVSGCQEIQEPEEHARVPEPACGLETYQELVGLTDSMLEFVHLPEGHRILRPEMAATTDYVPTRLNVSISEDRTVTRVSCG